MIDNLEHFRYVDRFCGDPSCARFYRRAEPDEAAVLAAYSTPGLRRGELTQRYKRDQLYAMGVRGADADKVVGELYDVVK